VPVPGPGTGGNPWPDVRNVMSYHSPRGLPRIFTRGQRNRVVCTLSYQAKYGQIDRKPRAVNEPCTLRAGGDGATYGPIRPAASIKVAHGACASRVCLVSTIFGDTDTICASSTCSDGLVGEGEASRDCGGACPDPCPTARPKEQPPTSSACFGPADCASGVCTDGVCHPTCTDGAKGGSELGTDAGGAGYAAACGGRGSGDTCRFDADCAGALRCDVDRACILDTDCPVNQQRQPCDAGTDCPGGQCAIVVGRCATGGCVNDAGCPASFCDLSQGRCACTASDQCPGAGNFCQVIEGLCTNECIDGRCLGTCELQVGGG
jgi:hypothetical protein